MRRALVLVLAVLPLAACGGNGSDTSNGPLGMVAAPASIHDTASAEASSGRVVVKMGEDWFRPSVIRAAPGARLTLMLENVGVVAHAFDIAGDGQKVDVIVAPGKRAAVQVRVPTVGKLLFFCKFHWSRGMAGYLQPG